MVLRALLRCARNKYVIDITDHSGDASQYRVHQSLKNNCHGRLSWLSVFPNSISLRRPSDALKNQFERGTLANKLMLKKQYFRMEMTENTTVESHLKTMKELTDRLAAIDAPISEEDQVLGSLPKPYALETQLELGNVQQSILHEERKLSDTKRSDPESTALIGSSSERQKQKRTVTCFECGEPGHFRRDCPEFKQRMAARKIHRAKPAEEQESDSEESCNHA